MDDRELPFSEHLEELRQRLKKCVWALVGSFVLTYVFREQIFHIVQQPIQRALELYRQQNPGTKFEVTMHFKDPIEPFFTYMKIAFYAALILAVPFILYQIWKFVAPGLYRHERRATLPVMFAATVMFVLGGVAGHQIALPLGYFALLSYAGTDLSPMIMMQEYVSITLLLILAFGLVFEMPVVLIFLCRIGLITPNHLKRFRRYNVVITFVIAAILTPGPDVISQLAMAVPMIVLYELSIIGARWLGKPVRRDESETPERVAGA